MTVFLLTFQLVLTIFLKSLYAVTCILDIVWFDIRVNGTVMTVNYVYAVGLYIYV